MEQDLSLREALAEDRLDDFVRQEEDRGAELANGSEFERALALLVAQRMSDTRWMSDVRSARSVIGNTPSSKRLCRFRERASETHQRRAGGSL
jgi:hypothetical protein